MKAKIVKDCRLSPNGFDSVEAKRDEIVEGQVAELAVKAGMGVEVKETKPKGKPKAKAVKKKPAAKKPAKAKQKKPAKKPATKK